MAKRVALILSGCGAQDGTEIREALFAMLALERQGAQVICMAPKPGSQKHIPVDHFTSEPDSEQSHRDPFTEAARIARGKITDISEVDINNIDALVIPGGAGVASVLSDYGEKGPICKIHPDVERLIKGCLSKRKAMGFICMAPILAARVLGPIVGVRLSLGPRGTKEAKNAALMGADVRPCEMNNVIIDEGSSVVSTPAYMYSDASLAEVFQGVEKLVRAVLSPKRTQQNRRSHQARLKGRGQSKGAGGNNPQTRVQNNHPKSQADQRRSQMPRLRKPKQR